MLGLAEGYLYFPGRHVYEQLEGELTQSTLLLC